MKELRLVKAIVRYRPINPARKFVQGNVSADSQARYLLMQKAIDAYFSQNVGKWECVGGRIKPKETSIDAITREMTEETGLGRDKFKIVKQLPILNMTDEEYDSHCDVYLIDATSTEITLSEEHSEYRWFKAEDIKKQALVKYAGILLEFFNNPEEYFN